MDVQRAETQAVIHKVEELCGADRTQADALLKRLKLHISQDPSSHPPQTARSPFTAALNTGGKRMKGQFVDLEERLRRMNRDKRMKQWERKQRERLAADDEWIRLPNGVYTTAKPRPSMYMTWNPDLCPLPVAYGAQAPFNPLISGASMRHIRRPSWKPADQGFPSLRVIQVPRHPISAAAATS